MMVKLTDEQVALLENGTKYYGPNGYQYLYLPFWYRRIAEGIYEPLSLDKLPADLTEMLKKEREPNIQYVAHGAQSIEDLVMEYGHLMPEDPNWTPGQAIFEYMKIKELGRGKGNDFIDKMAGLITKEDEEELKYYWTRYKAGE